MGLSRVPITARDGGKVGKAVAKSHAGEALRQTALQVQSSAYPGAIAVTPASGWQARQR
ncbi:MAG: hypothetical protein V3R50_03345 [Gammaproteobacteria bacterium]|jgi:hypothetical protein